MSTELPPPDPKWLEMARSRLRPKLFAFYEIIYKHGPVTAAEVVHYLVATDPDSRNKVQRSGRTWAEVLDKNIANDLSDIYADGLIDFQDQRRPSVLGTTTAQRRVWFVHEPKSSRRKTDLILSFNSDEEAHAYARDRGITNYRLGQSLHKKNVKHAEYNVDVFTLRDTPESIREILLKNCPEHVCRITKALAQLDVRLRAHVLARLEADPSLATAIQDEVDLLPFFPGLQHPAMVCLKEARCFDPERWKVIAALDGDQSTRVHEVIVYGKITSKVERWERMQPFPRLAVSTLERYTGTDESGLCLADFIHSIIAFCDECTRRDLTFSSLTVSDFRKQFLLRSAQIAAHCHEAPQRWSGVVQALALETEWSEMVKDRPLERIPDASQDTVLYEGDFDYPIKRWIGIDGQARFVLAFLHRVENAVNFFARNHRYICSNIDDVPGVRLKFFQYFSSLFAREITAPDQWKSALLAASTIEDWSGLLVRQMSELVRA